MSELAFCKTFLSAIDARPIKLSSDYVSDARTYPATGVPILPRLPAGHPQRPNPRTSASNSTTSPTLTITLKPMKPTPSHPTLPIPSLTPSRTSIFDLKTAYATHTNIPASKIKILYKKKPVTDSKLVSEIVCADAGEDVEFSVMVMGGATVASPVGSPAAVAPSEGERGLASAGEGVGTGGGASVGVPAVGPSGKEVVATDEFWGDLKTYLLQRIKDEQEGERLVGVFRKAWENEQ